MELEQRQKLHRYYLYGLTPSLCLWFLISLAIGASAGVFFALGFFWPYLYYTPGFEEKASSKAYRFSLLGNIYKIQNALLKKLESFKERGGAAMARLLPPLIFSLVLEFLNPSLSSLWVILGWIIFEAFLYLAERKKLNLF